MAKAPIRPHRHNIVGDGRSSSDWAGKVGSLRGGMVEAAENNELPPRFVAEGHASRPAMIILDTETGRRTTVGLFAYGSVRQALNDMFGPPPPTLAERAADYGMATEADGDGYRMEIGLHPQSDNIGYRITVEGEDAGWLVRHAADRWAVVDDTGRLAEERFESTLEGSLRAAVKYVEDTVVPAVRPAGSGFRR